MEYITTKRFRGKGIGGVVNIPYGTRCTVTNNIIYHGSVPVCFITSQIAYNFFSNNDDGRGLERGELARNIIKSLEKRDKDYQTRWDNVWNDSYIRKFKRVERDDFWTWNFDFYNASIDDLEYIKGVVSCRKS